MRTLTINSRETMRTRRDRLMQFLEDSDMALNGDLRGDTPLLTSGELDSLGLFNLALFIESEIDRKIDITAFDLAKEWNTVDDILNFIDRLRASG